MKFKKSGKWPAGKSLTLFTSLLLILSVTVAGALAYLYVESVLLDNTFKVVHVSSEVQESFDGYSKSNVSVKNTGDINAWIRVALVPTWEDGSGNAVNQTASLSDLSGVSLNTGSWFKGSDGYYYCKTKVSSGAATPLLFTSSVSVNTSSAGYLAGYSMNLQILCEAIQSEPDEAVEVWPVTVSGDALSEQEVKL